MLESLLGIRLILKMGKGRPKPVPYDIITALTNIDVLIQRFVKGTQKV